jgi:YD repeat-containing protein
MGPGPAAAGGRAGGPPQVERPASGSVNHADYLGTYRSDELGVTYTVQMAGTALRMIGGLPRERTLTAGERDTFRSAGNTYRFERDSAGRVTGFTVEAGRVRNIRFVRTD